MNLKVQQSYNIDAIITTIQQQVIEMFSLKSTNSNFEAYSLYCSVLIKQYLSGSFNYIINAL